MLRTSVVLSLLLLLSGPARGDVAQAQSLSELNSISRLLCASALLYFDPDERNPDPRSLTMVFHHLQTLITQVRALGQPPVLEQPLQAMQGIFNELDSLPRQQAQQYPPLLERMLVQQKTLQSGADEAYGRLDLAGPQLRLLHLQSEAIAAVLLDYQLRHTHWVAASALMPAGVDLEQADRSILEGFDEMLRIMPGYEAELQRLQGQYSFVRRQFHARAVRGHGGVEFYLSRIVLELNELALARLQAQG